MDGLRGRVPNVATQNTANASVRLKLKSFLQNNYREYHRKEFLSSDPLEFVHQFETPLEQEWVAIVSALLAYGKVAQIKKSVQGILDRVHNVSQGDSVSWIRTQALLENSAIFEGWVHRFNVGSDIAILLGLIAQSWRVYGSVGNHFASHVKPEDETIESALNLFIDDWRSWLPSRTPRSVQYLLTAPRDGSSCKRWCMLLRWMVREDELDRGLWKGIHPHRLVIPIDTHVGKIARHLKLCTRNTLNWKAALEITRNLKKYDREDPTRYDFSLARVGILDLYEQTPFLRGAQSKRRPPSTTKISPVTQAASGVRKKRIAPATS